jgi:16S rRNA (guanine527-N7)-methyltransferase
VRTRTMSVVKVDGAKSGTLASVSAASAPTTDGGFRAEAPGLGNALWNGLPPWSAGCRGMNAVRWQERLQEIVATHGMGPDAARRLAGLLELLRDDPTAPTTVTDPDAALDAHVTDSLDALAIPALRGAVRIADVGSGAGFPGLPLALALPDAHVDLVESVSRKCAFLERAVQVAHAENAGVACARIEEWPARDVDVVTVRAVAPLAVLVEYAAPVLVDGGTLVAWKGTRDPGEEAAGARAADVVGLEPTEVRELAGRPGADHRTLHVYRKVAPTPPRFPRRPGMARKRPLST